MHDIPYIAKYELVPADNDFWAVKLLETKYAGVTYRYGKISFVGEDEEGNAIMSFEYDIIDPAGFVKEEIVGKDVDEIFGNILQKIIIETLEAREKNGNNREDDSEESDSQ